MQRHATLVLFPIMMLGCATNFGVDKSEVDWGRYYTSAETAQVMRSYARHYPQLARVSTIGHSYEGRELLVIEVSNRAKGDPGEKPALYVDGNIHSGELTGSAVTLYLLGHLLENYGKDPRITALLDQRTFYLRPKFNPDGADLALATDTSARSTLRPYDNDNDGQEDEDPGDDLNGDGYITRMRIADPEGNRMLSAGDPRIMIPRAEGVRGPFYRVLGEGIDNDGDGKLNEDGIGGLDMNRNFPRNWALTYKQPGAGPYPLSEPETMATVRFIDSHENITGIVHNHTSGGFVYRLPSASDPALFNKADLALIETLGAEYSKSTGRPVRPSSTHATNHRYGTLISWAYWDRGIIGWVPEYWPGLAANFTGGEEARELERLRIDDEELGGRYFVEWTPHMHPEYGRVEVGGWRRRFTSQNPPPEMLEAECAMQIPWILYLAEQSPLLVMEGFEVRDLGEGRFRVEADVRNVGFQPTNLTERGLEAEVVAEVHVLLELNGAELETGSARVELGHLAGSHATGDRPRTANVSWVLRRTGDSADVRVVIESEKGGTLRSPRVELMGADKGPVLTPQTTGSEASLRGLCAVNSKVAWASGAAGTFLRTVDGGDNWHAGQVTGAEELDFRDVQAFTADRALLISAGQPARIYGTEDGGQSFKVLYEHDDPAAFFDGMAFWNEREGIVFSDPVQGKFLVLRTEDGGMSWHELAADALPSPKERESGFAASGTCAVVGPNGQAWIGTGGGAARILRSTDGGRTFAVSDTSLRSGQASTGVFSVAFADAHNGIAVGGDYQDPTNTEGNIAVSTDGGLSWQSIAGMPPGGYRSCVASVPNQPSSTFFTIGRSGADFSRDGGRNWWPCSDEGYYVASFAADGSGWVAGSNGRIARVEWK